MPVDPILVHEMTSVGLANHIDPRLVAAIVVAESSGNTFAVSSQNAIGLMQINAKVWAKRLDFSRNNPFDPVVNLRLGVPILASCIKQYHWLDTSLAAYRGDVTYSQDDTGDYVDRVIRAYERTADQRVVRNPGHPVDHASQSASGGSNPVASPPAPETQASGALNVQN
ncbi:MAG: transglycosylase SLT domain-containing protein [Acidobacteriia bacterium]|nr:transglycosylase SLT domain-containing protein [Terriglobia bacterium]